MKKVPCFAVRVLAVPASAEHSVHFHDAGLKAAAIAALEKTNPTPTDMLALTDLYASGRRISDLTGIGYATCLQVLYLTYNQISNISPLSGITNLQLLDLESDRISDLSPLVDFSEG